MDSIEEFDRKYRNSYIQFERADGTICPAYVNGTDLEDSISLYTNEPGLGEMLLRYPECGSKLHLDTPEAGYFNHHGAIGYALYLFKEPGRQWQRGLTSTTHKIYNPFQKFLTDGIYRPKWGMRLVNSIFKKNFTTSIIDALNLLGTKKCVSVAITKDLMISLSPLPGGDKLVWWRTLPVGILTHGKIEVHDQLYEQEVHDELTRTEQVHWIVR